jgi:hypothetical protein
MNGADQTGHDFVVHRDRSCVGDSEQREPCHRNSQLEFALPRSVGVLWPANHFAWDSLELACTGETGLPTFPPFAKEMRQQPTYIDNFLNADWCHFPSGGSCGLPVAPVAL